MYNNGIILEIPFLNLPFPVCLEAILVDTRRAFTVSCILWACPFVCLSPRWLRWWRQFPMFSVPAALQGAPWDLLLPPAASWWRARSLGFVLSSAEQESRHFLAGQCLVYSQFLFLAHLRLPLLIYLSLILVNEASFHIFISHLSLFFLPFFPLFFNGFLHTWFTNFFFLM